MKLGKGVLSISDVVRPWYQIHEQQDTWECALIELVCRYNNVCGRREEVFFYLDWWDSLVWGNVSTECEWLKNG